MDRTSVEQAFNVAHRILGAEDDAAQAVEQALHEVAHGEDQGSDFRPRLFAATLRTAEQLLQVRGRVRPEAPPGALERQKVPEANVRLPDRQREALALREMGQLSYAEIAGIMDLSRDAVAQLIARARINLDDELGGTVLVSVAPSRECERALALVAMREDGELDTASPEAAWLDAHLADCDRCTRGIEAMREAAAAYRGWAPIAAAPWLIEETTTAKAAEGRDATPPRRHAPFAVGLVALLLLAGLGTVLVRDDQPAPPVDEAASAGKKSEGEGAKGDTGRSGAGKSERSAKKGDEEDGADPKGGSPQTTTAAIPVPTSEGGAPSGVSNPGPPHGDTTVSPTRQTSTPSRDKPTAAPTRESTPPTTSAPAPAPTAETPPPTEEADEPPRGREPPGKPASPGDPPSKGGKSTP